LQSLGAEHPNTLMTMANLGHLLQHQGNLEAAGVLLEPALAMTIRAPGADHPDSYQRQHFLALLRMEQGRLDEAVTLPQIASAGFAAHFGESNHPAK
jgi:hypothetical protein